MNEETITLEPSATVTPTTSPEIFTETVQPTPTVAADQAPGTLDQSVSDILTTLLLILGALAAIIGLLIGKAARWWG